MTFTFYVDQTSGWLHTPKGTQDMPAQLQKQIRDQASRSLTNLLVGLPKQESAPVATGDGKVQVKTEGGNLVTFKINASTGEIENISYAEEEGSVMETFSDWRDVSGVKLPFKTQMVKDGKPLQSAVASEVKINTGLKPEELSKRP